MCLFAWPTQIKPSQDVRHQYIHAVDVVPTVYDLLGIEPPAVIKGYPQSPIEGESFAAALTDPTAPGEGRRSSTRCSGSARSTTRAGWPAPCTRRSAGGGSSSTTSGSSTTSSTTARSRRTSPPTEPERLETLKSLWFYYAGIYNGLPLDDRSALEQVLAERPHGAPDRQQYTYYPRLSPTSPSRPVSRSTAGRTRSPRASRSTPPTREGVLFAHGGVAGGHSLYVKDKKLRYTFNWLGTKLLRRRRRPRHHVPARTSSPPSSRRTGRAPTRRCPASPAR